MGHTTKIYYNHRWLIRFVFPVFWKSFESFFFKSKVVLESIGYKTFFFHIIEWEKQMKRRWRQRQRKNKTQKNCTAFQNGYCVPADCISTSVCRANSSRSTRTRITWVRFLNTSFVLAHVTRGTIGINYTFWATACDSVWLRNQSWLTSENLMKTKC